MTDADECGGHYWDRFHAINEYIYERAQITSFSITGGSAVNFNAVVGDTTECARFVLNLIRCPLLTDVSFSGLPAGAARAKKELSFSYWLKAGLALSLPLILFLLIVAGVALTLFLRDGA